MTVPGQLLPGNWAERPEFSQIQKMRSVPLAEQLATFMDTPEIWMPLRSQLLVLYQLGYRLAEFVDHLKLDRTVVLTCIGDVLPGELELISEAELKSETTGSAREAGPSPSELPISRSSSTPALAEAPLTVVAPNFSLGDTTRADNSERQAASAASPVSSEAPPASASTSVAHSEPSISPAQTASVPLPQTLPPTDAPGVKARSKSPTLPPDLSPPQTSPPQNAKHLAARSSAPSVPLDSVNGTRTAQPALPSPSVPTPLTRNGSGSGTHLAVNHDMMEMISDDDDDAEGDSSATESPSRDPSPASAIKRAESRIAGCIEDEVSASDTAVHLEDDSASDMDIEDEEFTSIIDGVWGTLKAGNHSRVRPSAADLNVGFPPYGSNYNPQRALFKEQPQNLVIHLSDDSESDDSEDDRSTPVAALPPPVKAVAQPAGVKARMNLLEKQKKELQEKMKLLEARRKKAAPAVQSVLTATSSRVQTPSVETAKSTQAPPPPGPVAALRITTATKPAAPKPALVAQAAPVVATTANSAQLDPTKDAADSVLAIMSATRQTHKAKLELEIAVEEAALAATQADVARSEVSINNAANELRALREKREGLEKAIARRKEEIAALNRQIAEDEQETANLVKEETLTASRLSLLKKQALSKGNGIPDLHRGINAKRAEIMKLSEEFDNDNGDKPKKAPLSGKRARFDDELSSTKRAKTSQSTESPAIVVPTEYDEQFVQFLRNVLAGAGSVPVAAESPAFAKLPHVPETSKEDIAQRILEPVKDTLEPLLNISGHLRTESDIALMSNVHSSSSFPANEWWNSVREGGQSALKGVFYFCSSIIAFFSLKRPHKKGHNAPVDEEGKRKALAPYSSHLSRFRSFRFSKNYDKDIKSLTWSNKIDPFVNLCRFETEGGVCHDASCKGQHFRDISMSEKELAVDLISYTATEAATGVNANLARLKDDLQAVGPQGTRLEHLARAVAHHQRVEHADDIASMSFGRQSGALPRRVSASDTAASPETSVAAPSHKRTPLLPPTTPILISGVRAIIDKEKPKHARYYKSGVLSEDDLQAAALADPKSVSAWVEYAVSVLPLNLALNDLAPGTPLLDKPLNVLSRALQANRDSEELWSFYMELYGRVGARADARESFEQAVRFVKSGWSLWWRWCFWEKETAAKIEVMHKMVDAIVDASTSSKQATFLDASFYLAKLYIIDGRLEDAKTWLRTALTAADSSQLTAPDNHNPNLTQLLPTLKITNTIAFALLDHKDVAIAWILLFHLEYFGSLPSQAFHTYPYAHLVRRQLWEIKWKERGVRIDDDAFTTLSMTTFTSILNTLDMQDDEQSAHSYLALLRNMRGFKNVTSSSGLVAPTLRKMHGIDELQYMENKNEGWLKALRAVPAWSRRDNFARWNLYIKIGICNDRWEEVALGLVNCARSLFEGLDPLSDMSSADKCASVEDAVLLYRKALALHVPSLRTPDLHPDLSRGDLKANAFLWLNYLILLTLRTVGSSDEGDQELRSALDHAIEAVRDQDGRKLLWIEYLRFQIFPRAKDAVETQTFATRDALAVVTRAVKDVKLDTYGHPGLCALPKAASVDFTKPVPLRDLEFSRRLFTILVELFPRAKLFEIVDFAAEGQLPLGAIPAIAKAATNPAARLKIVYHALTLDPTAADLWNM
ncbi:Zinc finger C3H1 domain-containing protein [Geranomyces variabilis]|nr:Zinc finger C3H1 domain-containing protein [Geranomyces variabilis]